MMEKRVKDKGRLPCLLYPGEVEEAQSNAAPAYSSKLAFLSDQTEGLQL